MNCGMNPDVVSKKNYKIKKVYRSKIQNTISGVCCQERFLQTPRQNFLFLFHKKIHVLNTRQNKKYIFHPENLYLSINSEQ